MTAPAAHVETRGLAVARGERELVRDLNLAVPRGRFVAVTGPSGVGKSSLLACLAGLLAPAHGTVSVRDLHGNAHAPWARRRHLGFIFQHLRLAPNVSARTNVLCGLLGQRPWWRTLAGFPRADRTEAAAWLERLELSPHAAAPASRLSGGERQRLALARALIGKPEVILADEPVSALDPRLARLALNLLRDETRTRGATVFCVLHDADHAAAFADLTLSLHREDPGAWTLTAS